MTLDQTVFIRDTQSSFPIKLPKIPIAKAKDWHLPWHETLLPGQHSPHAPLIKSLPPVVCASYNPKIQVV